MRMQCSAWDCAAIAPALHVDRVSRPHTHVEMTRDLQQNVHEHVKADVPKAAKRHWKQSSARRPACELQ